MNIAIIEDEPKLSAVLEKYLQAEGYRTVVYDDGAIALDAVKLDPPDFILLDLMLPGLDGMSLCREVRKFSDVPIIMTTARVEEIDRLLGLEIGADDYVCKPYSPREVVARMKTIMRRTSKIDASQSDNSFVLNENSAKVKFNEQEVELTSVELQLLSVMYQKPGQIFNRSQLMNRIYPDRRVVSDRTIDSHVKKLRQKLSVLGHEHEFIHSVYGIGYKFEWREEVVSTSE